MPISADKRLTRAFNQAKRIPITETSKFIIFSDCHRGDNSYADDFTHNSKIYQFALNHYFQKGFTYIELGDGDELWENDFDSIFNAHKDVYMMLKKYHDENRLHFIWGNHDMNYKNSKTIIKNLSSYQNDFDGKRKVLMPNASFSEAIRLEFGNGECLFLLHGHQADWFNYVFWKLSRFLVKYLWKPLQIFGVKDPTSPAQNFKELIRVEKHIERWIRKNNNQVLIAGHTHRPRFPTPEELPYFNDGSCVHPRCITGLEIENYKISLVKWYLKTNEDGALQIEKETLEGAENLSNYLN